MYFINPEQLPPFGLARITSASDLIAAKQIMAVVIDAVGVGFYQTKAPVISKLQQLSVVNCLANNAIHGEIDSDSTSR
jgi:hypothetical protein